MVADRHHLGVITIEDGLAGGVTGILEVLDEATMTVIDLGVAVAHHQAGEHLWPRHHRDPS